MAAFGIFASHVAAENAVDHLHAAGFSNDDVSVLMTDKQSSRHRGRSSSATVRSEERSVSSPVSARSPSPVLVRSSPQAYYGSARRAWHR